MDGVWDGVWDGVCDGVWDGVWDDIWDGRTEERWRCLGEDIDFEEFRGMGTCAVSAFIPTRNRGRPEGTADLKARRTRRHGGHRNSQTQQQKAQQTQQIADIHSRHTQHSAHTQQTYTASTASTASTATHIPSVRPITANSERDQPPPHIRHPISACPSVSIAAHSSPRANHRARPRPPNHRAAHQSRNARAAPSRDRIYAQRAANYTHVPQIMRAADPAARRSTCRLATPVAPPPRARPRG